MLVIAVCIIIDHPDSASPSRLLDFAPDLPSPLYLGNKTFQVDLSLDGSAVRDGGPAPHVTFLGIGTGGEERPQDQQIAIAARKVQRGIAIQVGILNGGCGPAGYICQEDLQYSVVAAQTGVHDGVAAADVAPEDRGRIILAEEEHDLRVAGGSSQHQGRLVALVEGGAGLLMAKLDEELADGEVVQRGGEVEVGVGEALG